MNVRLYTEKIRPNWYQVTSLLEDMYFMAGINWSRSNRAKTFGTQMVVFYNPRVSPKLLMGRPWKMGICNGNLGGGTRCNRCFYELLTWMGRMLEKKNYEVWMTFNIWKVSCNWYRFHYPLLWIVTKHIICIVAILVWFSYALCWWSIRLYQFLRFALYAYDFVFQFCSFFSLSYLLKDVRIYLYMCLNGILHFSVLLVYLNP